MAQSVVIFLANRKPALWRVLNKSILSVPRVNLSTQAAAVFVIADPPMFSILREGANKRGNSSRLTQSFHFFMFEPIFSPVNALNQPI
ncbi:hypothetical protein, partial [Raoultella ornithinolytica]|uniref:hypothetical protein n=1 Tax=Raoultella ornithinolytica TaxID=54291 RepID=UPI001CDD0839